VVAWLRDQEDEQLFLSAVTMGELQAGIEQTKHQDPPKANEIEPWVDQLAASYQILPMDTSCLRQWSHHGPETGRLGRGCDDGCYCAGPSFDGCDQK
jgi:predicted nucleic acid-binding protein